MVDARRKTNGDDVLRGLNRGVRSKHAKVSLEAEMPFGASLRLRRYRLGNGLAVMLMIDRSAPVVSYQTWFRVGSRHEVPGKTGLAHLFEHLMFNETKNLPAGEFDRLLEAAGGETNAATWTDWTFYYENVPKARLDLVVRLEADRMQNLILRDRQVTSEKEVVANERRYRVDDDVEGTANERLYALAFREHPYKWPTIGWMQDIEGFTIEDCEAFYKTYYAPNNATVVIVGDVDERDALALVQTHYGAIRSARLPEHAFADEPVQRRERRLTIHQLTPTEKVLVGMRGPSFSSSEYATLTVANEILLGGRSSRLYQRLVNDMEMASEVRSSIAPFRDPGLYEVWVSARPKNRAKDALAVLEEELGRFEKEPVSDAELEKAKNRLELAFLQGMETASGKAEQIGFYETVLGDPTLIFARLDAYRSVTAADIVSVAKTYFRRNQWNIVTVLPKESSNGTKPDAAAA